MGKINVKQRISPYRCGNNNKTVTDCMLKEFNKHFLVWFS